MADALTKSQLEKLGRRLRKGTAIPDDLRLLASYRRAFLAPYQEVIRRIALVTSLVPSGRPAKSTVSIVAKLQRQTGTLPQMQDIAGCRLVAEHVVEQDMLVDRLRREFSDVEVIDRRAKPSSGYRAVHVILTVHGVPVEVQIRTRQQDLWAQCSEELAFSLDPAIKYGGGPPEVVQLLKSASTLIANYDRNFRIVRKLRDKLEGASWLTRWWYSKDLREVEHGFASFTLEFKSLMAGIVSFARSLHSAKSETEKGADR